jgi:hypothetical protein
MKKIITLFTILMLSGLMLYAQNPFLKDQSLIYLKVNTDKVGIGAAPTSDKVTISSVAGETPLGLKGYPGQWNPFISLYNSNSTAIWKLYANADWWTIGQTMDTTLALLVGRSSKGWLKVNGVLSANEFRSTTGTYTNLSTTGNLTSGGRALFDSTLYYGDDHTSAWRPWASQEMSTPYTRMSLQNLGNVYIQAKGSLSQVLAIQRDTSGSTAKINLPNVKSITVSDTLGIELYNKNGTKYRLHISNGGAVLVTVVP